ncbi:MAG: hypothetical protein FJ125_11780 [Deltaproteobacteria bacterium]|nr:hypothetical protein [Deltaproteobacteria bacterium]
MACFDPDAAKKRIAPGRRMKPSARNTCSAPAFLVLQSTATTPVLRSRVKTFMFHQMNTAMLGKERKFIFGNAATDCSECGGL